MKRFSCVGFSVLILSSCVWGQGLPTFGSLESDGITTLNRYNLGYTFRIGLPTVPSRGTAFAPGLTYKSFVWELNGSVWSPVVDNFGNPTWGWNQTVSQAEQPTFSTERWRCVANDGSNEWTYSYSGFATSSTSFPVSINLAEDPDTYPECSDSYPVRTSYGIDYSGKPNGYLLSIQGTGGPNATPPPGATYPPNYNNVQPYVFAPSGSQVDNAAGLHDTNGNYIVTNGVTWLDSIGRTALTIANNTTTHQTTYSYYDSSHTLQPATMALTSMSVYSSFACSGKTEYSASGVFFPTSLTLADGSVYTFSYEYSTISGHTSAITGRISQITLPTGGYIQFAYSGGYDCTYGTPMHVTKTVNDLSSSATWTYVRTNSGG